MHLNYDIIQVHAINSTKLEPFMLPPSGTDTIADFKILAHVNMKQPKKDKSAKVLEDDS